jgi:Fur family transcriptional regulator, ferric uptake regulator
MDEELRDRWLAQVNRRLSRAGRRSGAARTAVVELLARDGQCLLSPHEIIERLRSESIGSAASVYRALDELLELGLVHRLDGRDGTARYEIADPATHHHHFLDEESGEIRSFTDMALDRAIAEVVERLGVELTSHDVILRGVPARRAR